jgi:hypothetical protein
MAIENVQFEYDNVSIKDIIVAKRGEQKAIHRVNLPVLVNDRPLATTNRFWNSLYSRYGFNSQFEKFFSHDEIFERIHKVVSNDKIRICVESDGNGGTGKLLAVSNPNKPVARYEDCVEVLQSYGGDNIRYNNGELSSLHAPSIGGSAEIAGDLFHNRFAVNMPIDGYGQTSLYLAMLRQICTNGAIAMSKAFRSTLQLGKGDESVMPTLVRALESYNNDEGFHALRQRMESATKSWASVYEVGQLHKQLIKMHLNDEFATDAGPRKSEVTGVVVDERYAADGWDSAVLRKFREMTGDVSLLYGLANLDALSPRRQKTLPVKCTMYDMVNFATEVSTHHANPQGQHRLSGWFGTTVSNEYELENTCTTMPNFADFHLDTKLAGQLTGSEVLAI